MLQLREDEVIWKYSICWSVVELQGPSDSIKTVFSQKMKNSLANYGKIWNVCTVQMLENRICLRRTLYLRSSSALCDISVTEHQVVVVATCSYLYSKARNRWIKYLLRRHLLCIFFLLHRVAHPNSNKCLTHRNPLPTHSPCPFLTILDGRWWRIIIFMGQPGAKHGDDGKDETSGSFE